MESITKMVLFIILAASITFNRSKSKNGETLGVTTVKTINGDVYTCVDIYKQPSLKHPALKDPQEKERLYKYLDEIVAKQKANIDSSDDLGNGIWENESCPIGTVPIRQESWKTSPFRGPFHWTPTNTRSSILNDSIEKTLPIEAKSSPHRTSTTDFAGIIAKAIPNTDVEQYSGAWATINIYNPHVQDGTKQLTSASVILESEDCIEQVAAGWVVSPFEYGDQKTRMFTYWRVGSNECFNDRCPGFVITNRNIPVDYAFPHISSWERDQFDIPFIIQKKDIGWEFSTSRNPAVVIGHWPAYLFKDINQFAQRIRIGGQVYANLTDIVTPPMGSGKFKGAYEYKTTCYMRHVYVGNRYGDKIQPQDRFIDTVISRLCYDAGLSESTNDPYWNYRSMFGGPGGKEGYTCI